MRLTTMQDVHAEIIEAIEGNGADVASRDEYDIAAIADRCYEYSPELRAFVQTISPDEFWPIVEEAAL